MKYVISVSKTYKHRGLHRHRASTKKYWHIYYYDYNENNEFVIHSKQVNSLQAFYYKLNKYYKRKFYCFECENVFVSLVKKRDKTAECPYCEL